MSSLCTECLPAPAEVARLTENAQAGRREAFVGTGDPDTVLACPHGQWRLGDVLDATDEAATGTQPEFEDHPDMRCGCGRPVVRLASTAAGVPGRWRKGCAEHSTGRKEAASAVQAQDQAGEGEDGETATAAAATQDG